MFFKFTESMAHYKQTAEREQMELIDELNVCSSLPDRPTYLDEVYFNEKHFLLFHHSSP